MIMFYTFRLVYDRETGKPKGYGFCEYQDVETAQSAMRNLNNYDFNGRPLRVGVAAGEQNRDEMKGLQQALGGPIMEVRYRKDKKYNLRILDEIRPHDNKLRIFLMIKSKFRICIYFAVVLKVNPNFNIGYM